MSDARSNTRSRWYQHLWREWTVASRRPIAPVRARPTPDQRRDDRLTATWLGHATVLINFFGVTILTDPSLFPRIGIRVPFLFTIGPKRLTQPALRVRELPPIDLILLSHAHFDHLDLRTLHRFGKRTAVVTASRTRDLLHWTRLRNVTEMSWGEGREFHFSNGSLSIRALRVNHWGARIRRDTWRGYNGYLIERNGRRIIFSGDTAMTDSFAELNDGRPYDLGIFSIGAYDPWIRSHANPEQVVAMADAAGIRYLLPIHHQTFRLSAEPFREPIERFSAALASTPDRIALREIGETFLLPMEDRAPSRPRS